MFLLPASPGLAAGLDHEVSNLRDKGFTVSWLSQDIEPGQVNYGTSPDALTDTAYDDRGQAIQDYTHHVTIINLTADATYYYRVVSGGVIYDNNGSPYQVTTGPALDFLLPNAITGKLYQADGFTAAEGAIIHARIGSSQVLSALINNLGAWAINIAPLRSADGQSYYEHSDSNDVVLEAWDGTGATTTRTVTVDSAIAGAPDMILTTGTDRVRVTLQVTLKGRPTPPHDRWAVPVTVWVHDTGTPWTVEVSDNHGAIACHQTSTNAEGNVGIGLEPGTYDIRIKGAATLMNLVENITVREGMALVDFGTLIEGDINGDNSVSTLDYSAMVMCFGYATNDPQAPAPTAQCDLNGDGYITALDYSIILMNFGQTTTQ